MNHEPDACWPIARCIDPDNCPVVYAVMMQEYMENYDIKEMD